MKTTQSVLPGAGSALALLLLAGCNALTTTVDAPPNRAGVSTGIPYLLPKGDLEFTMAVKTTADGKFSGVDLQTETRLVPDAQKIFLLHQGFGLFTHHDQRIALKDGMLSSIHTADEGQADQAVKAIAATWLNVLQIGALQGTLGAMSPLKALPGARLPLLEQLVPFQKSFQHEQIFAALEEESVRAAALRRAYPELLSLPAVGRYVASIDAYFAEAWQSHGQRERSMREEQAAMLVEQSGLDQRFLWTDRSQPLEQPYARDFKFKVSRLSAPAPADSATHAPASPQPLRESGIYVKVPVPVSFQAELLLERKPVYLRRLAAFDTELTELETALAKKQASAEKWTEALQKARQALAGATEKTEELKADLRGLPKGASPRNPVATLAAVEKQPADYAATIADLAARLQALQDDLDRRDTVILEIKANLVLLHGLVAEKPTERLAAQSDPVFTRSGVALMPSHDAINIPLPNSAVGKTTFDLQLAQGILTSYTIDRPSSTVEFLKIPVEVTGAVVDFLTKFIQLKIDLVGDQKKYADAQLELEKTKYNLSQVKSQQKRQGLEDELKFRNEILTLQSQNLKLTDEIQATLAKQAGAAELNELGQASQVAALRATIGEDLVRIEQNKKRVLELENEIKALQQP